MGESVNGGIGEWEDRTIGKCPRHNRKGENGSKGSVRIALSHPLILPFLLLFTLSTYTLQAQVAAPDFLCVTNDTLRWDVPTNTCGAFQSYIIYVSQNEDGPYNVLDSVSDMNQTSYYHRNAGTSQWFYFLQSRYNCPGQTVFSSDTLDNRIPEPPVIRFVSVAANGAVQIGWTPSSSPEAYAYVISKNTPSGTAIIDTVINGTTYTDTSARANERVETYYVVTLDRCGNTSLIPPPHSTLLLKATSASACERSVKLEWALYKNWQNAIEKHEILVNENGGIPKVVGEAAGNATSFTVQNAKPNIEYCFSVRAVESVTGNIAVSSQSCQTLDVIPGVTQLVATNATVAADNTVTVNWIWNTDAAIKTALVQRATDNRNFTTINSQTTPTTPLQSTNTLNDAGANPNQSPVYYQIKTTDDCNAEMTSNVVATVFLESATQGTAGTNVLKWTPYLNENAVSITYELYRLTPNSAPVLVTIANGTVQEYVDQLDLSDPNQTTACYFILTKAQLALSDGIIQLVESQSNTACSSQDAKIYIPNAFAPLGANKEFRPYLQFGEPADYTLSIFDRWGGLLFQTKSFSEGWDGRSQGKDAPQGVYTYLIKLTQNNGEIIQRAGTVLLVR